MAAAAAGDRRRHRRASRCSRRPTCAGSTARAGGRAATATRSCLSSRPRGWRASSRRPAVRRARLRPRGHGPPAGPVQRGAARVLSLHRGRSRARAETLDDARATQKEAPNDDAARALPRARWRRRGARHFRAPLPRRAPAARRPDARPPRDAGLAGQRGASAARRTSGSSPRWTSTTGRRSTTGSAPTRCAPAGRILREIAPGLATFLVARGRAGPSRRLRLVRGGDTVRHDRDLRRDSATPDART